MISGLLEYAAAVHGDRELVSYPPEEPACRGCYRTAAERARRLATVLQTLGVGPGDRVATLACSTHRHLEVFYAAAGIGAVCHTVNPRLHPEQIAWILNHAGDVALFVHRAFLSQAEAALGGADRVRHVVMMADQAHMPEGAAGTFSILCYEELLATGAERLEWPQFDLIKCAGEWISSVEIESLATEHPAVVQAAVIGVPDEKWGERPVLIVVLQPGSNVSESDFFALYDARVAKWCVPVRVVFVDSLPMSATGKVQKNTLRELYANLYGTKRR